MAIDRNDSEIRAFVAASKAGTFSAMEADCLARFGADRAWPAALLATVRREVRPTISGGGSPYEAEADVVAFVRDRADLLTLDALRTAGRAVFGDRFPTRSPLHRLVVKLRSLDRFAWSKAGEIEIDDTRAEGEAFDLRAADGLLGARGG